MIIDEQALPEGGPLFSGYQNEDIIISSRQFSLIASDNEEESKQHYDRLSELLGSNRLFVVPFCDACLIYRHLKHANDLGAKILEHPNLFWYTDGFIQTEVDERVNQSYAIPGNFVAEFSGQVVTPQLPTTSESRFVCLMNNHREHRDHTLLNLHHRKLMYQGNVVYHQRTFDVPGLLEQELFADTREKDNETYKGHITDTPLYNDVMIELVSEAFVDNLIFITEKAIRPMSVGIPAIYVAGYQYVQALRDCGFKMYDNVINHDYDNEPDDWIRISLAVKELKAILDSHTPQQLYDATIKDTLHNQKLLTDKYLNKTANAFLKQWLTEIKETHNIS